MVPTLNIGDPGTQARFPPQTVPGLWSREGKIRRRNLGGICGFFNTPTAPLLSHPPPGGLWVKNTQVNAAAVPGTHLLSTPGSDATAAIHSALLPMEGNAPFSLFFSATITLQALTPW